MLVSRVIGLLVISSRVMSGSAVAATTADSGFRYRGIGRLELTAGPSRLHAALAPV
jgi:hypothetical protein